VIYLSECILDEITHVIKTLTGRNELKVNGSYTDENKIYSVQINAEKTPISDENLATICELYDLKYQRIYDTRKKGYSKGLGRNIRYLLGINKINLSLIL
jgi:hypothetical protein